MLISGESAIICGFMSEFSPEQLFYQASYRCQNSRPNLNDKWLKDNERSVNGDPDLKRAIVLAAKEDPRFSRFFSALEEDPKTIRVLSNNGWFLSCTFNFALIPLFLSSEDVAIREKFIKFVEERGGLKNLFFVHYVYKDIFDQVCMFRYELERVREFQISQQPTIYNNTPYKSIIAANDPKLLSSDNEPYRHRSM